MTDHRLSAGSALTSVGFLLTLLVVESASGALNTSTNAELIEVRKIWDRAPHNAFTDLVRHNGR